MRSSSAPGSPVYTCYTGCENSASERSVLEMAENVGGTRLLNRYPGARCDIESIEYALPERSCALCLKLTERAVATSHDIDALEVCE